MKVLKVLKDFKDLKDFKTFQKKEDQMILFFISSAQPTPDRLSASCRGCWDGLLSCLYP